MENCIIALLNLSLSGNFLFLFHNPLLFFFSFSFLLQRAVEQQ